MHPALRVVEREMRVYQHLWRSSLTTTFLNPVLYLAAMGLGLGTLVDRSAGSESLEMPYLVFLGPGLLAAASMQTAAGDSSFGVMAGIKWLKSFHAQLATPISVRDLVVGRLLWSCVRVGLTAGAFAIVLALFGALPLLAGIAAVAPAVLTGLAFAGPIAAYTATLEDDRGQLTALFRFGIVPMFLFSGVFFPVAQLPGWLQPVAYAAPLWHGVSLSRAVAVGLPPEVPAWISVAYLAVLAVGGTVASVVTFRKRLTP